MVARIANAVIAAIWRLGARRALLLCAAAALAFGVWRLTVAPATASLSDIAAARAAQAALGDPDCRLSADLAMRHAGLLAYLDAEAALDAYFDAFGLHPENASLDRAARLVLERGLAPRFDDGAGADDPVFAEAAEALGRDDAAAALRALRDATARLAGDGRIAALATAHEHLAKLSAFGDGAGDARRARWFSLVLFHAIGDTDGALAQALPFMHGFFLTDRWRSDVIAWRSLAMAGRQDGLDDGGRAYADVCTRRREDRLAPDADRAFFAAGALAPGIAARRFARAGPATRALIRASGAYLRRHSMPLFPERLVQ